MKDLIVPVAIIAVLGSMLLPLPPAILDVLLAANLIFALSLLILTLYISEPLKLSVLPSLLLLATLFRLSLNVSTTRLILGSGEAGRTIEAFGTMVVQGNVAVGLVIFLIITLIQFLVIAKGAERVAEVSARFSLDAMPGRQMSIDADVRSGMYDYDTARKKREELQIESRFYGALDGAMKFIKGDAIAGLVIVVINIIGGFVMGLLVEGLGLQGALSKYTILTIGDGLVSQIPALLNSIAAGMVVTRVSRGDGISLSGELLSQLGQSKSVHVICGLVSLFLGLAPGMPTLPFFISGIFLLFHAGLGLIMPRRTQVVKPLTFRPRIAPLFSIILPEYYVAASSSEASIGKLEKFRQEIFELFGVLIKRPEIAFGDEKEDNCELFFRGIRLRNVGKIPEGVDSLDYAMSQLGNFILCHPEELIDDTASRRLLDYFDPEFPELISAVIPTIVSATQLTELLKGLLKEGISIKHFDIILQAVAEAGLKSTESRFLLQEVRVALKRHISEAVSDDNGVVHALTMDPLLDLAFARAEDNKASLNMDYLELVHLHLKPYVKKEKIALVVSKRSRLLLSEYLALQSLKIPVIAHEEIVPEVKLEVIEHIAVTESEQNEELVEALAA